ncbi:hypothetical protein EXIGLDRAFT_441511 [Exidia glandulosa HHB12029]|uniref:Uncharacterized protein n=1 Tax=Exidia glandulosa HHB12029 TaxID=1314781 RepID=A0A166AXK8_EXIGL|nr:hypothetical protein EXIGLDRAFT_441511 [Exidia glandulosa HHB12029]
MGSLSSGLAWNPLAISSLSPCFVRTGARGRDVIGLVDFVGMSCTRPSCETCTLDYASISTCLRSKVVAGLIPASLPCG